MSRVEQSSLQKNVASKMLQWKSVDAAMSYYDKDSKENVTLPLPFEFVVLLKDYVSFNGFHEATNKGFWSNEVKNPNDMVHIRCGNDIVKSFKKSDWKTVKELPELKGCKYTQIAYVSATLPEDDEPQIYRIMLNGASLTGGITVDKKTGKEHADQETDGWIRFTNKLCKTDANMLFKVSVVINGSKSKKNGAVNYTLPVFEAKELDPDDKETNDLYEVQYKQVLDWFTYYNAEQRKFDANPQAAATSTTDSEAGEIPNDENDI